MARLANISGKEAVKAFRKAGWEQIGQEKSERFTFDGLKTFPSYCQLANGKRSKHLTFKKRLRDTR